MKKTDKYFWLFKFKKITELFKNSALNSANSIKGSALIQVFIMSGLLSVLGLVLTKNTETQRGSSVKVASTFEFDGIRWDMEQILLSDEACSSTFGALNFASVEGGGQSITQIRGRNDVVIYEVGSSKYANNFFKINSMTMENATHTPSVIGAGQVGRGRFDLKVEFELMKQGVLGGTSKTAVIPVSVELDNTYTSTKCFSEESGQTEVTKSDICQKVGGTYFSILNKCGLTSFDHINGLTSTSTGAVSNAFFNDFLTSSSTGSERGLDFQYINSSGDTLESGNLTITGGGALTAANLVAINQYCVGGNCQNFRLEDCNGEEYPYQINSDGTINCRPDKSAYGSGCTSFGFVKGFNTNGSPSCDSGSAYTPTPTPIPLGLGCPDGYVEVPGSPTLGTSGFCVMKYEAKAWNDVNSNSVIDTGEVDSDGCSEPACTTLNWGIASHSPVSVAEGSPWRRISMYKAWEMCDSVNSEALRADIDSDINMNGTYALISNAEWMTIARNAENVITNWSGGSVGSGCLFRGNNGINDACGYDGADPESGAGRNVKARLILDIGSEVWDMAGNLWEWTDWGNTGALTLGPTSCSFATTQLPSVACGALNNNDYNTIDGTLTSSNGAGLFRGGSSGGVLRSGSSIDTLWGGVFTLFLLDGPLNTGTTSGFRCVYRPPIE